MKIYLIIIFAMLGCFGVYEYHSHTVVSSQTKIAADALAKAKVMEAAKDQADTDRDAAKKQADVFKGQADAYLSQSNSLEGKVKALQAKLAGMAPLPPVANLVTVPTDTHYLAQAYAAVGFAPVIAGESLAFTTLQARPMLVLVEDGKFYPEALAKISTLSDEVTTISEQKSDLAGAVTKQTQRGDELDLALSKAKTGESDCEGELAQQKVALDAKDKVITQEKHRKVVWGIVGAIGGFLLKFLIVSL